MRGSFLLEDFMYYLRTEQSFDAAHFLKGYAGKCSNLHGHRWRVVAVVKTAELATDAQTRGMVMDFSALKDALKAICAELDHHFIYETGSLQPATLAALDAEGFHLVAVPFRPTAENLSRYIYERLAAEGCPMARVEVYETPNNCAIYEVEA